MPEYVEITADPESKYVFKPGVLYFADFKLSIPIMYFDDMSMVMQFEDNLTETIKRAGEQAGQNIEVQSVLAEIDAPAQSAVDMFHVTGTLDPGEAASVIDEPHIYGFRVYFRTHTPAVVLFVGIVAVALAMTWLAHESAPILQRICEAAENMSTALADTAKTALRTPEKAIRMLGKYAIPLAGLVIAFGIFIWPGRK